MFLFRMSRNFGLSYFLATVISGTVILTLLNGNGVQCLEMSPESKLGPIVIKNGTESSVVLDCDYAPNENDYMLSKEQPTFLVVKWFFNNDPRPVYQWIHSKKPQDLGVLKGKINTEYRFSEDNVTMYRAIQILNPTTNLSGEYKCTVFNLDEDNEKSQTRKMIIYVPEKNLELTHTKLNGNTAVNITCKAEGVFPEPKLTIRSEQYTKNNTHFLTIPRDGVFDAVASAVINDSDLEAETRFECELKIPETNYTVTKAVMYTPANSAYYSRVTVSLLLPSVLLLCLRL